MGRLQRDECRSGRRLHVLVHPHVLSRARSELGHTHWIVQIFDLLWRRSDAHTNCFPNADGHRNSWRDTDTDSGTYRSRSHALATARLHFHFFNRHFPMEPG